MEKLALKWISWTYPNSPKKAVAKQRLETLPKTLVKLHLAVAQLLPQSPPSWLHPLNTPYRLGVQHSFSSFTPFPAATHASKPSASLPSSAQALLTIWPSDLSRCQIISVFSLSPSELVGLGILSYSSLKSRCQAQGLRWSDSQNVILNEWITERWVFWGTKKINETQVFPQGAHDLIFREGKAGAAMGESRWGWAPG